MKFNVKMPAVLKPYYHKEMVAYRKLRVAGETEMAWCHLERAHILGQRYPLQHSQTHWEMLCMGFRENDLIEILGQLVRLLLGGPLSFVNYVPVGNVGSTRVSMIKPQKIPEDLAKALQEPTEMRPGGF